MWQGGADQRSWAEAIGLVPEEPVEAAQAEAIARGLMTIAGADGVHADEVAFIAAVWSALAGAGAAGGTEGLAPLLPAELSALLPVPSHRRLFLRAARSLVGQDGVLTPSEEGLLIDFSRGLGVPLVELIQDETTLPLRAGHPLAAPLPPRARAQLPDLYRHYLDERNGTLDAEGRLPTRERYLERLGAAPVRFRGAIDAAAFARLCAAGPPPSDTDELTLFLLVLARINRLERYGVLATERAGLDRRTTSDLHMLAEERYHTEFLARILESFGLRLDPNPPRAMQRAFVDLIVRLPKSMTMPLALCVELVGAALFCLLTERAATLLAAQPALAARTTELLGEVLTDEIAHAAYCRGHVGAVGIAASRALLPAVMVGVFDDLPDVALLFGPTCVRDAIARFDVHVAARRCVRPPFWMDAAPEPGG